MLKIGKNESSIDFSLYDNIYDDYFTLAEILVQEEIRRNDLIFKSKIIIFFLPVIISIGIIGNILNIIVFSGKKMKICSTFRFLLYLSVVDLLVLLICASDAFLRFGYQIEIRTHDIILCRLHTFVTYFLTHASSTILMIISIDRALVVSNKKFYLSLLRFKKFERIERKDPHNYLCGLSLCCILNCGITSSLNNKQRSSGHRSDIKVFIIFIILFLINGHFLFLLNLNPTKNSVPINQIKHFFKNNQSFHDDLPKQINSKETTGALFCYPYKGKFSINMLKYIYLFLQRWTEGTIFN